MKIVADENIPFLDYYFDNVTLKPGRLITREDLVDADILLVRSVIKVNESLLKDTPVKFVGTTTTGVDHIDTKWLEKNGITYRAAQGCNAIAVADYVIAIIASLQKRGFLAKRQLKAAVIGVGNIGSRVAEKLKLLGFDVIESDPPRAQQEPDFISTPLDKISDVDFITLHTPLTEDGPYATYHMIDKKFLARQKDNCVLLNTGRGSVISFDDLKMYGGNLLWCLDVFEGEPWIDFEVLDEALIATPHIAGYSEQAKYRGIAMIYTALCELNFIEKKVPLKPYPRQTLSLENEIEDFRDVILKMYDPYLTSARLKSRMIENPKTAFDLMRNHFAERSEFAFYDLLNLKLDEENSRILHELCRQR
jgi:erythronate-4-phosphate dehydrogenase